MEVTGLSAFESVEAFYAADERRRRSPELDFGVWWRHRGVVYRLSWVEATGELIVVQLSPPRVEPFAFPINGEGVVGGLGTIVVGGDPETVTIIGRVNGREVVERLLDGWADWCGEQESLAWVLDRVRSCGLEVVS
jgi:hypothetical protein